MMKLQSVVREKQSSAWFCGESRPLAAAHMIVSIERLHVGRYNYIICLKMLGRCAANKHARQHPSIDAVAMVM